MSYACPICRAVLPIVPRYPQYVCEACASRATDADDRPLAFANVGFTGGYAAAYADTGAPYDSHACWIDGIRCYADEARFGGIVIQVDDAENKVMPRA